MKIVLASDHGGFDLKESIKLHLAELGYEVLDQGCFNQQSVDYPDYGVLAAKKVLEESCLGIIFCGTGIGISIAANKVKGIRAALCHEEYSATMARCHNNANILALGGRTIGVDLAKSIVDAFLEADFEGGRHQRRVEKIMKLEEGR
ncbi:MAG: ribose 5-phosphate isomerase B [Tissierellia bacterium]|nr:ribose 5-phosphate isomerase B [Tissierellia bacterium]